MGDLGDDEQRQPFVRPARLVDAADFAAVQHRSWLATAQQQGLPEPPSRSHLERAWERAITVPPSPRHRCWVALDRTAAAEVVTGVAALAPASDPDLDPDRCVEVVLLAVDPSARGRGHGSRLLVAALETAVDDGDDEAVAWVASDDDVMRQFLEGAGWAADGAFRTVSAAADDAGSDPGSNAGDTHAGTDVRQVRLATSLRDEPPSGQ